MVLETITIETLALRLDDLLQHVPEGYRPWIVPAGVGLLALLVLRRVWRGVVRAIRRRRPASIHPRLEKYNVDHTELDRKRRELAQGVVATSTGNRLAGYRLVRQVEAVFVEGFRTPQDALIALKAAAVERGANGLLNVSTERTAAGRCTASGDAVVVADMLTRPKRAAGAEPPPLPRNHPNR